jgi:hypothetical protein
VFGLAYEQGFVHFSSRVQGVAEPSTDFTDSVCVICGWPTNYYLKLLPGPAFAGRLSARRPAGRLASRRLATRRFTGWGFATRRLTAGRFTARRFATGGLTTRRFAAGRFTLRRFARLALALRLPALLIFWLLPAAALLIFLVFHQRATKAQGESCGLEQVRAARVQRWQNIIESLCTAPSNNECNGILCTTTTAALSFPFTLALFLDSHKLSSSKNLVSVKVS